MDAALKSYIYGYTKLKGCFCFQSSLHVLMLIDVTFLNGVSAPGLFSKQQLKICLIYLCNYSPGISC